MKTDSSRSSRGCPRDSSALVRYFGCALSRFLRDARSSLALILTCLSCCVASVAQAQAIANTFEDGTTQGWGPRGSVAVTASTDVAHSGAYSLRTTGRTATWNGPALDLRTRVARNASYQVSAWVRLVAGQPTTTLKFTLERTPVGGSTTYSQITTPLTVTDSAWVQVQGTLTLPPEDNSACTLYLESPDATAAYYLDDFTITALSAATCPEPHDQSGILTDFEAGGAQGWSSRGSAVLTNVATAAHEGSRSLSVTGRAASWQGPSINALCKMHKGSKYIVSIWVRLLPGEPVSQVRVSLQTGLAGVVNYLGVVGNTTVTDAAWVNLSTQYTFASDVDQLSLYVETASGTASFYIDDFALIYVPEKPIQTNIPSLKDVLAPYFPVGAALEPEMLLGVHRDLLLKHYNQMTFGNALKWDATEPSDGVFTFSRADTLANFARANGFHARGHTLLWHSQTPAWVFRDANGNPLQAGNADHRALLLQRLQRHIQTVMSRYKDLIDTWDVVNEPIDPSQPNGLRNSPWLQIIGPDYIDLAFQYAHAVDPNAALFLNDYSTEDPKKRAALQIVVQGLLDRHVPIHGVGHQAHINVQWPDVAEIRNTLKLFAGMGLMNEITEFDMSAYTNSTDTSPVSQQTLTLQGYRYRDVFNVYREFSPYIKSVTFWGLGDDTSWLKTFPITRDDKPLPFDEASQAKPAYWGIVDPAQLPIVPKALNLPNLPSLPLGAQPELWNTLAPQPLSSNDGQPSWAWLRGGWSGSDLYVQLVVADTSYSTGARGDSVEFFLGDMSYKFLALGRRNVGAAMGRGDITPTGYVFYAIIPSGQNLAVGSKLKFDARVTDSQSGRRVSWSDTRNGQDADRSNLGTLTVIPEKKIARAHRGTPVIDGQMEGVWNGAEEFQTQTFVLGASGATARVRTLWDDNYLYVYAQVSDPLLSKASPNVWEQDSVELFVDLNNGQTTTYQSDDAQYRVNYENTRSFGGAATSAKIISATQIVPGGYVVEAAIAIGDLATANAGKDHIYLGFDAQVNDDGAGNGTRSSVATWNDTVGNDYMDTSRFGVLDLVR